MSDNIFDRVPMPPAAQLLGWRLIDLDVQAGTIEVGYEATPAFANASGHVQGGVISAMLDDAMGPAAFAMAGGERRTSTIDLHTHFIRPAPIGPLTATARVTRLGRQIAYMEGRLFNPDGKLCAHATASAMLVEAPKDD